LCPNWTYLNTVTEKEATVAENDIGVKTAAKEARQEERQHFSNILQE
jgi:hypothetical protein